jgi:hypothetical protein
MLKRETEEGTHQGNMKKLFEGLKIDSIRVIDISANAMMDTNSDKLWNQIRMTRSMQDRTAIEYWRNTDGV